MTAPLTIIGSASIRSSYLASLAWKETCTVCYAVQLPSRRRGGILVVSFSGSRSGSRLILSKLFVVHIIIPLTKNRIEVYITILNLVCYMKTKQLWLLKWMIIYKVQKGVEFHRLCSMRLCSECQCQIWPKKYVHNVGSF